MVTTGCVTPTKNPDYPFLDTAKTETVADYLVRRNILLPREGIVRLEDAGPRPRNCTVRVVTTARSFILKHFQEWPANGRAAPPAGERFRSECQFHRSARIADCVGRALPEVLHQDTRAGCILFEDVGEIAGASGGASQAWSEREAEALAWFLVSLHHHSQSVPTAARYRSEALLEWQARRLFGEFGPGPAYAWRRRVASQGDAVATGLAAARACLAQPGGSLVHGDFTPGNWVRARAGSHVVDAEFSFFGRPELDAGAFLAGLLFTRQPAPVVRAAAAVLARGCCRYDARLTAAFAAAQLGAMLDERAGEAGAPRGSAALALVRRIAGALEHGALERLAR
jgi:5-methylthioribose kinase